MITAMLSRFAAACDGGSFFGIPKWYKYLECITDTEVNQIPKIYGISDVWLIAAAIIDILLRIAVLAAIAYVVYGGIQYISSRGEPDKTSAARSTIINALIGLVVAVAATALVTFVAGRFH